MTVKKTILHLNVGPSLASSDYWRAMLSEHFNFVGVDPTDNLSHFNKQDYVIWTSHLEPVWYTKWQAQGYKIIYDKLWDHFGQAERIDSNILLLLSDNFIFVNEVLKYKWRGIDKISIEKKLPDKLFLCLMNAQRSHRDQLFDKIKDRKNTAFISYVAKDQLVYGDTDHKTNSAWHSYLNRDWYTRSYFSLVAETSVQTPGHRSEKMFKPFAFKHPMLLWASTGSLEIARDLGFQTFNFLFDESYDSIQDVNQRFNKIIDNLNSFCDTFENHKEKVVDDFFSSQRLQQVLEHNYNQFYKKELTAKIITKEIVNPVLEFIDA